MMLTFSLPTLAVTRALILGLTAAGWALALPAYAQRADDLPVPLTFSRMAHDFGTIAEGGGPQQTRFWYRNPGRRTVTLTGVRASCGCTTPRYRGGPIAPGDSGLIEVSFDPKGRPGPIDKTLEVFTDKAPNRYVLHLRGQVAPTGAAGAESRSLFGDTLGPALAVRTRIIEVGRVSPGATEPVSVTFQLNNRSGAHLGLAPGPLPSGVQLVLPRRLQPGETAVCTLRVRGRHRRAFGQTFDPLPIQVAQVMAASAAHGRKGVPASPATSMEASMVVSPHVIRLMASYLVEDAPEALTPEARVAGPMFLLTAPNPNKPRYLDFGTLREAGIGDVSVRLKNVGKAPLTLYGYRAGCACITVKPANVTLAPGKETTLRVTLDGLQVSGGVEFPLSLYLNDRAVPRLDMTVGAELPGQAAPKPGAPKGSVD